MTNRRFTVSLAEVEQHWSLDDLCDAHGILDALEEAERVAHRRP